MTVKSPFGSPEGPDFQRLAAFHQFSPNPLVAVDATGEVTFASDAAKRALEPLGPKASAGAFFPADMDSIMAHLRRREPAAFRREVTIGSRIFDENIQVRPDQGMVLIHATDVTELRRAEQELRSKDAFLTALVESPTDIQMVALDREYRYTAFNTAHARGMKAAYCTEIRAGMGILDAIAAPDVRSRVKNGIDRALSGESFTNVEFDPDGDIWFEFNWSPIRATDGSVEGVAAFARDITRRKRVETALADSELKYRSLYESSNDAIMLLTANQIFDCNPAALRVFGYSTRDEFLGKHPSDVSPQRQADGRDSRAAANERIATAFQVGRNYFEWLHQRADGTVFPADVLLTPMDFHGQKVLQATVRDISDRKQAEQALRESEQKYRLAVETAGEAILVVQDGRTVFANARTSTMTGYPGKELLERPFIDFIHPEDRSLIVDRYRRRLAGEDIPSRYDVRGIGQDGATINLEVNAAPTVWNGRPAILYFLADITDRSRAEAALRESEERFRRAFEYSGVGKLLTGLDGRLLRVNRAFAAMLGYTIQELQARDFQAVTYPDDVAMSVDVLKRLQSGTEGNARFEKRYIHKDGSVIWVDLSTVLLRDSTGRPEHFVADVQDISDRKRAEAALTASEERYRRLVEDMGEGIGVNNADERFTFANRAAEELFGVARGGLVGRSLFEFLDAKQAGLVLQQTAERRRGERSSYELDITRPDGSKRTALVTASPRHDDLGNFTGSFAIFRDISDRKQAELVAGAERDRMLRILDAIPDGVYIVGQDWRIQYINPALLARGGPVEGRKCYEYFHGRTGPCPDCASPQAFAGSSTHREYTTRQGGTTYDIQDVPVTGDDGGPARLVFLRDITERKRAELRDKQHLKDTALLRDTALGFITLDPGMDIYGYIARRLAQLAGEAYIVVNSFDEAAGEFRVRAVEGIGDSAENALRLLGRPPAGMMFKLAPEELRNLARQGLQNISGGLEELAAGKLPEEVSDALRSVFVLGESFSMSLSWQGKVLGTVYILMHKDVPLRDPALIEAFVNQAASAIQHRRDAGELVQHREHLEELVRDRTAALEAANRELEAFSYSVSHDLRTPLRAIDGFTQALVEDCGTELNEKARSDLDRVCGAARRMSQLIDDLLDLARIARLPLERKEVDLSEIARTVAAELSRETPDRKVKFVIPDNLTAPADPVLAERILRNLLGNSWKFTSSHAAARIEFGKASGSGEQVFFVRDDGVGFDMTYADKLFAPFQRLHAGRDFPGSGIGLAIVQRIVRRHGGRVWIQAEVDGGATCWFTLEPAIKE